MQKILLVGGILAVLTWSGLRVWSARTLTAAYQQSADGNQQSVDYLTATFQKFPAYKLTFLGARFLRSGDYEFAKAALEAATKKDRFYRDAFKYYAYALQATGDTDSAELALRRAKTLDPRVE